MIAADFYRISEEALSPALQSLDWRLVGRGWYQKDETDGESRVALDPLRGHARFRVLLTFDPTDVQQLADSLFDRPPDHERGFLCGPYLTPGGVFRRHGGYACRTRANLERSLATVISALQAVGLPWLQRLRNPQYFAEQADPIAALMCGYAWERAGNEQRAQERYREMWRRLDSALSPLSTKQLDRLEASTKRQYLFIAGRLGITDDLVARLAEQMGDRRGGPTRN